jgi:hypothetical protein
MSIRCVLAVLIVASLGCPGEDPAQVTADAPPSGGPCTGAVYDPCTTADQCMSQQCHFYMQSNFTVCTQTCTPGDNSTCPVDASGANGVCNNMGRCKPAVANNCTR